MQFTAQTLFMTDYIKKKKILLKKTTKKHILDFRKTKIVSHTYKRALNKISF